MRAKKTPDRGDGRALKGLIEQQDSDETFTKSPNDRARRAQKLRWHDQIADAFVAAHGVVGVHRLMAHRTWLLEWEVKRFLREHHRRAGWPTCFKVCDLIREKATP